MKTLQDKEEIVPEEKPPLFSSWNQLYLIVFITMVLMIVLFYIFTKIYS